MPSARGVGAAGAGGRAPGAPVPRPARAAGQTLPEADRRVRRALADGALVRAQHAPPDAVADPAPLCPGARGPTRGAHKPRGTRAPPGAPATVVAAAAGARAPGAPRALPRAVRAVVPGRALRARRPAPRGRARARPSAARTPVANAVAAAGPRRAAGARRGARGAVVPDCAVGTPGRRVPVLVAGAGAVAGAAVVAAPVAAAGAARAPRAEPTAVRAPRPRGAGGAQRTIQGPVPGGGVVCTLAAPGVGAGAVAPARDAARVDWAQEGARQAEVGATARVARRPPPVPLAGAGAVLRVAVAVPGAGAVAGPAARACRPTRRPAVAGLARAPPGGLVARAVPQARVRRAAGALDAAVLTRPPGVAHTAVPRGDPCNAHPATSQAAEAGRAGAAHGAAPVPGGGAAVARARAGGGARATRAADAPGRVARARGRAVRAAVAGAALAVRGGVASTAAAAHQRAGPRARRAAGRSARHGPPPGHARARAGQGVALPVTAALRGGGPPTARNVASGAGPAGTAHTANPVHAAVARAMRGARALQFTTRPVEPRQALLLAGSPDALAGGSAGVRVARACPVDSTAAAAAADIAGGARGAAQRAAGAGVPGGAHVAPGARPVSGDVVLGARARGRAAGPHGTLSVAPADLPRGVAGAGLPAVTADKPGVALTQSPGLQGHALPLPRADAAGLARAQAPAPAAHTHPALGAPLAGLPHPIPRHRVPRARADAYAPHRARTARPMRGAGRAGGVGGAPHVARPPDPRRVARAAAGAVHAGVARAVPPAHRGGSGAIHVGGGTPNAAVRAGVTGAAVLARAAHPVPPDRVRVAEAGPGAAGAGVAGAVAAADLVPFAGARCEAVRAVVPRLADAAARPLPVPRLVAAGVHERDGDGGVEGGRGAVDRDRDRVPGPGAPQPRALHRRVVVGGHPRASVCPHGDSDGAIRQQPLAKQPEGGAGAGARAVDERARVRLRTCDPGPGDDGREGRGAGVEERVRERVGGPVGGRDLHRDPEPGGGHGDRGRRGARAHECGADVGHRRATPRGPGGGEDHVGPGRAEVAAGDSQGRGPRGAEEGDPADGAAAACDALDTGQRLDGEGREVRGPALQRGGAGPSVHEPRALGAPGAASLLNEGDMGVGWARRSAVGG